MAKICKRCNCSNEDKAHYCAECGTTLEVDAVGNNMDFVVISKLDFMRLKTSNDLFKSQIEWYKIIEQDKIQLKKEVDDLRGQVAKLKDGNIRLKRKLRTITLYIFLVIAVIIAYFALIFML